MHNLSKIDRRIIYELGRDARINYKELAKKIKSKKTVVSYHIQNLTKNNIIWKYVPVFSINRLGIYGFKIYVKLHGLDKNSKGEMIKLLVKDPKINWVAEATGSWDLLWSTLSANILEFAEKKNEFFKKFGKFIQDYSVTALEDALVFNRDYLTEKSVEYRKQFVFGGEKRVEKIDEDQKKIIQSIKNDGKFQVTKLAKDLNLNVRTVMSKVSDLEKRKIIQGYTAFLNINKIGLKFFKLCIYFQDFTAEKYTELLNFCKQHRNVIHLIKSVGDWDLELEIEAENVEYIYLLIEQIKIKFPRIVKKIDITIITKEHKLDFFPEF